MKDYVIITDVTSDMSPEIREYFGLDGYIHGYVHVSDGRDAKTTLDWENISRDDYYSALNSKSLEVTSAPATPDEYYDAFASYAKDGKDILYIALSQKISSTHSVASRAMERVLADYPGVKGYCLDSARMSGSLALVTAMALIKRREGLSLDENIAWLEANKARVHQMGPIDDLMVVARRGRISKIKAFFGSLAGVKPMGDNNEDGYVTVLGKAKGIKKALRATVEYVKATATDVENNYIIVTHTDREAYARELVSMLEAEVGAKKVFMTEVFSASATNIGPGMICAYFVGEPVSADNEVERQTLTRILEAK